MVIENCGSEWSLICVYVYFLSTSDFYLVKIRTWKRMLFIITVCNALKYNTAVERKNIQEKQESNQILCFPFFEGTSYLFLEIRNTALCTYLEFI